MVHNLNGDADMTYLTNSRICEMAAAVLSANEVTPLSHSRKVEVAMEHAVDEFGIRPRKSACLLAVKIADMGWNEIVLQTKKAVGA